MSLQNEGMQKGHHLPPAACVAGEIDGQRVRDLLEKMPTSVLFFPSSNANTVLRLWMSHFHASLLYIFAFGISLALNAHRQQRGPQF